MDDPVTATQLMRRVAETYLQSTRGVIGIHSQSQLVIKAPVFRRTIAENGWFVFVDGVLTRSSSPPDSRQPPVRDPFRSEYLSDYTFIYETCSDCTPGAVAVSFVSRFRDVEHAYGRIVIDPATARIITETETPYRLPWPTQKGALVATWGNVGDGWFPLKIAGTFVGTIGPFVGHAYYSQALTTYRRFAGIDEAVAALASKASTSDIGR